MESAEDCVSNTQSKEIDKSDDVVTPVVEDLTTNEQQSGTKRIHCDKKR